jgi:hypothetical protein
MDAPAMIVLSTGWNAPTKARCLESVAAQEGLEFRHVYIEASEQHPRRSALENTTEVIAALCDDTIVALVDGDDWLAHPRALATVQAAYDEHPETLCTYGSFIHADGRPGFAAPYAPGENVRTAPFRATHLKTFRARMFRALDPLDLLLEHARDHALMFPMLEMAGPGRARFIPEILYVYNLATSFEFHASPSELAREAQAVRAIRRRSPYEALP